MNHLGDLIFLALMTFGAAILWAVLEERRERDEFRKWLKERRWKSGKPGRM